MGTMGAMGVMGSMGAYWADVAAIYILACGWNTFGIGYMALWGFGAKCRTGWSE